MKTHLHTPQFRSIWRACCCNMRRLESNPLLCGGSFGYRKAIANSSGAGQLHFRSFNRAQLIGFMKQLNLSALNAKDVKDHLLPIRRKRRRR